MRLLALVRDPGARWVLVGWSAFTLENLLLSESRRGLRMRRGSHPRTGGMQVGPKIRRLLYAGCSQLRAFEAVPECVRAS